MKHITECMLVHKLVGSGGFLLRIAWIPSEHARVGRRVRLEGDERWWRVERRYGTREIEEVEDNGQKDFAKRLE